MRRAKGFVIVLCVLHATVLIAAGAMAGEVKKVTVAELKKMLPSGELKVIDVRTEKDWKESAVKIQGAVREDPGKVSTWMEKYPKDKRLVFYCA